MTLPLAAQKAWIEHKEHSSIQENIHLEKISNRMSLGHGQEIQAPEDVHPATLIGCLELKELDQIPRVLSWKIP